MCDKLTISIREAVYIFCGDLLTIRDRGEFRIPKVGELELAMNYENIIGLDVCMPPVPISSYRYAR
jgi:hypothetical protein